MEILSDHDIFIVNRDRAAPKPSGYRSKPQTPQLYYEISIFIQFLV